MIRIKELRKRISNLSINVSLEIEEASIFGIIGESGSGKTSLLKMLNGIMDYDSGKITNLENSSMVFQNFNLLENLTVFENVALPLRLNKTYNEEKVLKALEFVELLDKKDKYSSTLSGGEKQRVAIARAIITTPKVLLCDEPSASLDKSTTKKIIDLFLKINREYMTTIILVTHELEIAKAMCDKVALMSNGKIIEVFEVKKDKSYLENDKSYLSYAKEVLKNG